MKPKINNSCVKLRKQLFSTTIFQRVTDFRYTKSQSIYLHYPSGQEPESWRGCENFHNYRIVGNNTFHFTVKYRFRYLYSIALKLPINSQVFPLQFRTNGFRSDILDPTLIKQGEWSIDGPLLNGVGVYLLRKPISRVLSIKEQLRNEAIMRIFS